LARADGFVHVGNTRETKEGRQAMGLNDLNESDKIVLDDVLEKIGTALDGVDTRIGLNALAFVVSQVLLHANSDMDVFGKNSGIFLNQIVEFACKSQILREETSIGRTLQ
jgi:hypothetical protein